MPPKARTHDKVASKVVMHIISILFLFRNLVLPAQAVYGPPGLPSPTTSDAGDLLLKSVQTNATGRPPLIAGQKNSTGIDPPGQWQGAINATTSVGVINYRCNAELFGSNLRYQSCIDAIEQIRLTDDTIHTFGYRNTRQKWDVNVPQRRISREFINEFGSSSGIDIFHMN